MRILVLPFYTHPSALSHLPLLVTPDNQSPLLHFYPLVSSEMLYKCNQVVHRLLELAFSFSITSWEFNQVVYINFFLLSSIHGVDVPVGLTSQSLKDSLNVSSF